YSGASGGHGGAAWNNEAVSGSSAGTIDVSQTVTGGQGGDSGGGTAGNGGLAEAVWSAVNHAATRLTGYLYARGGNGGTATLGGTAGTGGAALANQSLASNRIGTQVRSQTDAYGGSSSGVGGNASSIAAATAADHATAYAYATGGSGNTYGAALSKANAHTS